MINFLWACLPSDSSNSSSCPSRIIISLSKHVQVSCALLPREKKTYDEGLLFSDISNTAALVTLQNPPKIVQKLLLISKRRQMPISFLWKGWVSNAQWLYISLLVVLMISCSLCLIIPEQNMSYTTIKRIYECPNEIYFVLYDF